MGGRAPFLHSSQPSLFGPGFHDLGNNVTTAKLYSTKYYFTTQRKTTPRTDIHRSRLWAPHRGSAWEAKVNEAESLRDFLDIYSVCDDKRRAAETRTRSIIEEAYRKNKNKENAFHPYKKDRPSSNAPSSSAPSRPPKLTEIEKEIIKACFGCYKCRKIFQSKAHITADSDKRTCDFPAAENYKPLTWEYANKLKQLRAAKQNSSSSNTIAATSSYDSSSSSTPSTSSIGDLNSSDEANFVAAMFGPLAHSSVIGNGSFSSESDNSVCQPFKSKHYTSGNQIND